MTRAQLHNFGRAVKRTRTFLAMLCALARRTPHGDWPRSFRRSNFPLSAEVPCQICTRLKADRLKRGAKNGKLVRVAQAPPAQVLKWPGTFSLIGALFCRAAASGAGIRGKGEKEHSERRRRDGRPPLARQPLSRCRRDESAKTRATSKTRTEEARSIEGHARRGCAY